MHSMIKKVAILLLTSPLLVMGQPGKGNYSPLPLKDLSSFEGGGPNWSVRGNVSIHPSGAVKPKISAGDGVLIGTPGNPISTKVKAGDIRFYIEFMVSPGATGSVKLPGGQKILISDSHKQLVTNSQSSGYIGQFPTQNAAKAPGLWQTLEVAYDVSVPQLPTSSRLNMLVLNGVNVLETVYLPVINSTDQPQPLTFEVNKGIIAFRNMGYQLLLSRKPVSLSNLNYKVYSDAWDAKTYNKLSHEGKSEMLTQEVTKGMREFHLVYEADIQVQEPGDYIFTGIFSGVAFSLKIDGKNVLDNGESTSQETHSGAINLSQGIHKLKLHYSRFPWRQPAMGIRVEKSGIRPYDLHVLSSLPEPEPKPYISVQPKTQPEMVRSFVLLDGEKYKRTHCISVGSPSGWNYTIDLNRGALLQAWRGNFANVSEMWHERGEPQLLFPAGLTTPVSGKSSIAVLTNGNTLWPDSANVNYLGFNLDAGGFPGYRYAIDGATVKDQLVAGSGGITRKFAIDGTPKGTLYALMASGKNIVQIEKGLYQVDNRYYVQVDKKASVIVRPSVDGQELILPILTGTSYTMYW